MSKAPEPTQSTADAETLRATTRLFELRNILVGHAGCSLTRDKIDEIVREIRAAMSTGPCAWAFKESAKHG